MVRAILVFVILAVTLAAPLPAQAHDARPLSIGIFEQADGVYRAEVRVPSSVESINQPELVWPQGCAPMNERSSDRGRTRDLVVCDRPLEDQTISFKYALFNPSISTVARFTPLEGSPRMAVLPPDASAWTVPSAPSALETARDYLVLGIGHILAGVDHLLFVAGLLVLAGTGRRILIVITGFTIAHSITLSLSALDLIELPILPAEAAIALSILFLAHEILRDRPDSLAVRYPVLVSSSFGLLHGLGFAAALAEIGLPQGEIVTSLLFFNLGVEVGQLAFVLPVVGIVWAGARLDLSARYPALDPRALPLRTMAAYAIGVPASYWFIARIAQF